MSAKNPAQRFYAILLAFGAGFLLYRTITMMAEGYLSIFVLWVSVLLIAEFLADLSCLVASVIWGIKNNRPSSYLPLRLGTAVVFLHALRVLVFALGRTGHFYNFDVRPEYHEGHAERWSWTGVYFATTMSILSIVAVFVIWRLRRKSEIKKKG
jgi:hypothetical protein